MTHHYQRIAFTPAVKAQQEAHGSRTAYGRFESAPDAPDEFTEAEIAFIAARDSFYMATLSASGWPYLQHRGGPVGFLKVLGPRRLGMADFRGNRQYISLGNADTDDRTALFLMDYTNKARLKLLARMRRADLDAEPELAEKLVDPDYRAKVEHGLIFELEAFDWNCPQHITPRFTQAEIAPAIGHLQDQIAALKTELAMLKQQAK